VIRRFSRMTAINSAIQVDVTGQVSADSIGRRLYSGVGGQMDFMRGAALAPEGRAIIALPSTAAGGRVSRIVSVLDEGAGVTTTRAHVRTVVTEYGIAELHGRSIRERAEALIQIAHPDFRDALTAVARNTFHL
jgi:acyl-CoA hydrolase